MTDQFADGTVIGTDDIEPDVRTRIGDDTVVWRVGDDALGRCCVKVTEVLAPNAPDAWFVLISKADGSDLGDDMVGMIEFVSDDLPDGTVVSAGEARELGVSARDRAATVTWVRDSGLVTNVRTEPDHRRHKLGVKLLVAADAVVRYHRWGGKLHGDGLRSQEGERLVASLMLPARIPKWTSHARVGTTRGDNPA